MRRLSAWIFAVLALATFAPAVGQNLDAGKRASQIFAEVCANCHRSLREFRSNPGTSFLREHYTTGSAMASTMSAYLSAGIDPRESGAQQAKRPPAATANPTSPVGTALTREAPVTDRSSREPRRAQQAADPKSLPPPGVTRVRPASARAETAKPETATETKPTPPVPPALEQFEE